VAYGLGLDASASVLAAAAFDDAALTRAGVGVSTTLYWGPERFAPRLVAFGLLVHATDGTARNEPVLSLITALNLSTLIDVAGGR
jgi:hypothetical protein